MLQAERDADDGQAACYAETQMEQSDFDATEDDPDEVHYDSKTAGVIGTGHDFASEWPQRKSCYLEQLQSERDADDGDAEQQSHHSIVEAYYDASKEEPEYVTDEFHFQNICLVMFKTA